ncbi:AfsR/SARP family transcriptional regulator [Nonomuraea endophytica]|uniref:DNA-binding SARP family transcriptional activator n=1 Tax=Nonomuraea endophytica TaxID=714136 RepID=A0A7W8AE50_9ACTN|nr:AfsR/SARP family transcriptional regulator [Nonomuraea endophytica]MBB5084617.1 DNA-binding SARP family transcriptional activator [Nonomuraea endophytica]
MVRIRVLGSFAAEVDGVAVPLGGPLQRAVLAVLVAARGHVVSADRLVDDLWHDRAPAQALASLQAYVSNLRRLLEPGRPPRTPARLLVSAPPGYALRLAGDAGDAVDAWEFERLLDEARSLDGARARDLAERALGLWRGPAYAEAAGAGWALAEVARLEELRHVARELRVAAGLRAGDAAGAVPEAEVLVREAPLREESWRLHALALWHAGRQGDALATLRRAREVMADELGLDPGPVLAGLESAILEGRVEAVGPPVAAAPAVEVVAPPGAAAPAVGGPRAGGGARAVPDGGVFVGRAAELEALLRAAASARDGGPEVALVSGEAGLGKTSLLRRLHDRLAGDGWLVATGSCPRAEGVPPAWAWGEILRAVAAQAPPPAELAATLTPLLGETATVYGDAATGRFLLHRAVWSWLAGVSAERPLAVMLDDLHWADAETLALMSGLEGRVLLVAAYRDDELDGGSTETFAALARREPLRLRLPGLARDAVAALLSALSDVPVDAPTVAALTERTGGNPFFVRETARLLDSEGAFRRPRALLDGVPQGVREVLLRRLARLPEGAVSVLRLAAVAGREASVDVLVAASDLGEEAVLDGVESALIAGLLTEPGAGRVRFVHALVRETVAGELSKARAERLHLRVGDALEAHDPDDASALAYHYARARSPKSVGYGIRAAELAEARFAHAAAVDLLTGVLAYLDDHKRERAGQAPAERIDLLGRLLRAQVRAGDLGGARATRQLAIDAADGDPELQIAAFTAWTGPVPWQNHAYGSVDRPLVALLERLMERPGLDEEVRCRLLDAYAAELAAQGAPEARAAARRAVAIAAGLDDPSLLARALSTLTHDLDPVLDAPERAGIAERLARVETPEYRWYTLFLRATDAVARNEPERALELVEESLELARRYRMTEPVNVGECALATLARIRGDDVSARRTYAEATARMAEHGSLHAHGYLLLVRAAFMDEDLPRVARHLLEEYGGLAADLVAVVLAAEGRLDEAREMRRRAVPIRADYFFPVFAAFRATAMVALDEREGARELYDALLPHAGGPPAGAGSMSVALPPPAHTLGQLARLLGEESTARAHFTRAAEIAGRWGADRWAADSREEGRRLS